MPDVSILCLSWAPDREWLAYCLRSVERFARGFASVTVAYPDRDDAILRPICERHGARPYPQDEPTGPAGHLAQNATKCAADTICTTPFIAHLDSDCVLTGALTPDDLFLDGRPVLVRRRWEHADGAIRWREPTARALGRDPQFETMVRLPITHARETYGLLRERVERVTGQPFRAYVLGQRATWPAGFCEFVSLGNVAIEQLADRYSFVTVPDESLPAWPIEQQWSHGEVTPAHVEWMEEVLVHGKRRPPPPPGAMTAERRRLLGL